MRRIALATALVLGGWTVVAAAQKAEGPGTPAPAVTETGASDTQSQQASAVQQALAHAQQRMQEQDEVLRLLREQIDRQGREIEALRQQQPPAAMVLSAAQADAAVGAAQLRMAGLGLRPIVPSAAQSQAAPGLKPDEGTGELFFHLGKAKFTPSGWVDVTAYYRTTNVGSGQGTTFQSIPYNNTVQAGQSEVRLSAQSSRIGLRVDENIGKMKAYGFLEADFMGYLPGNAYVSTTSNTLRMRAYYMNISRGKWEMLGGQDWSLITPTRKDLSPFTVDLFNTFHLDTGYQAGLIYARQAQVRFVYHPIASTGLGLSVENPEQFSSSMATFPTLFSTSETDMSSSTGTGAGTATPNVHPDIIAKATVDHKVFGYVWHAGVGGLLTSTRVFTPATVTKTVGMSDEREGGAAVANLYLELFKGFHLISTGYWSDGGGRYIGGMGPGFVVLQNGSVTAPFTGALLHSGSGIGGFEWQIPKHTILASYYSTTYFQRRYGLDPNIKTPTYVGYGFPGSSNSNNRTIEEASVASNTTLWQSPVGGAVQFITQTSWVEREPWYVAPKSPKDAHVLMEFVNLRYVLP